MFFFDSAIEDKDKTKMRMETHLFVTQANNKYDARGDEQSKTDRVEGEKISGFKKQRENEEGGLRM